MLETIIFTKLVAATLKFKDFKYHKQFTENEICRLAR